MIQEIETINPDSTLQKKTSKKKEIAGQKLGFVGKPTVVCGIPHSSQRDVLEYGKRNGRSKLYLKATEPKYGLPYGRDRIFLYYVRSLAEMRKERKIYVPNVSKMLQEMGLTNTGPNRKWLKEALLRCHTTLIYYIEGDPAKGGASRGELIIPAFSGFNFGNDEDDYNDELSEDDPSPYIIVSQHFYDSGCIPIDLNFIARLGRDYKTMDFYTWIRARLHNPPKGHQKTIVFPLSDFRQQFGFNPDKSDHHLKQEVREILSKLKALNFECQPWIEGDKIVIPVVPLRPILSEKIQTAFAHLDGKSCG